MRKIITLINLVLASILVLAMRALKPLVLIRLGLLRSERIGHLVFDTELYLSERALGKLPSRTLDLFYTNTEPCNRQLMEMYRRLLRVWDSPANQILDWAYKLNLRIDGRGEHIAAHSNFKLHKTKDMDGLLEQSGPHLRLLDHEIEEAHRQLRRFIPDDAPFVCFHVRDSAYMDSLAKSGDNSTLPVDFSYQSFRNCNIVDFIPAIQYIADCGYYALRMGAVVNEEIEVGNPRVIDYASRYRTELLDVYLSAHCHFFLATNAGLAVLPLVFRVPTLYVNFIPILPVHKDGWNDGDIFIPKKLWLVDDKRFMTFREMTESGAGICGHAHEFRSKYGAEVVDNTPDEICAAVREMDRRVRGLWESSEEDEELQRRAWEILKPPNRPTQAILRVGASFLRDNRYLLN